MPHSFSLFEVHYLSAFWFLAGVLVSIALGPQEASFVVSKLSKEFGPEWKALSPADRKLILRDCTEEGGVSDFAEYRRSIGKGNLQSYADTQRVRFAKEK